MKNKNPITIDIEATYMDINTQIKQYELLYQSRNDYGNTSIEYFAEICLFIDYIKPKQVLDYGCGQGTLLNELKNKYNDIQFYGYDPAIKEINTLPITKADMVINTDVLEHIPEDFIPEIIREISTISNNVVFCLHHGLAGAILPNGENAHCTIKPPVWYHQEMLKHFKYLTTLEGRGPHLSVVTTFPLGVHLFKSYYAIKSIKHNKRETQVQRFWRHLRKWRF